MRVVLACGLWCRNYKKYWTCSKYKNTLQYEKLFLTIIFYLLVIHNKGLEDKVFYYSIVICYFIKNSMVQ